jgi:threonine/homoserine/homoserine lactone efflux protein
MLSLAGCLVLLRISLDLWRVRTIDDGGEAFFTSRRMFMIGVLNGMAWMFWITVCTPQAMALDHEVRGGRWLFIVLFETGWVLSTLSLCRLFGLFRPFFRDERKVHLLYRAIALVFVLFALDQAWESASTLLS